MKLVNLTPHAICLANAQGEIVQTVEPSGTIARCKAETEVVDSINGIEIVSTTLGEVEGLPESQDGTVFITGTLVAQKLAGLRSDVVSPDTGPTAVREEGQVKAVKRFQRF